MSQNDAKRIGLIVGSEKEWPDAFMQAINAAGEDVQAALVKLGGTMVENGCEYDVIIDRMSHEVPYYRVYTKYAALRGCYVINNPFTWATDNKFFGAALIQHLGFKSPRTVVLPNKHIEKDLSPDSFRNLSYPMDWQGVIDYVGVPAIFKDIHIGGRNVAYRVHSVDELIQRYDESGTLTMVLQQLVESDNHIHSFVFGQEKVLLLRYDLRNGRYRPEIVTADDALGEQLVEQSLALTRAYSYDISMVEFVIDGDQIHVINAANPAPVIDTDLMTSEQFDWCVQESVRVAIVRAREPLPQRNLLNL